jgi:selenide,water dikinase
MVAGGTQRNHAFVSDGVTWNDVELSAQLLLADAQTSGGLLFAVDATDAGALVDELRARAPPPSAVVGRVTAGSAGAITIRP